MNAFHPKQLLWTVTAAVALEKVKVSAGEEVGVEIIRKALEAPARTIAHNAGFDGRDFLFLRDMDCSDGSW